MEAAKIFAFCLLGFLEICLAIQHSVYFQSTPFSEISNEIHIVYKRVTSIFGRNSKVECAFACQNIDTCLQFYQDDAHCVFGVSNSSDVTELTNEETVNPDGAQMVFESPYKEIFLYVNVHM